jgi:hypothetical protein
MTPGYSGAEIENLVNTAITEAIHKGKYEQNIKPIIVLIL